MGKPKNHVIPQFLLRGFTSEENKEQVFVYNKEKNKYYRQHIKDIFAHHEQYTVKENAAESMKAVCLINKIRIADSNYLVSSSKPWLKSEIDSFSSSLEPIN